jgi:hypothetical protein
MRMVIARFSWVKTGLALCFLLPLAGLCVNLIYQHNLRDVGFWLSLVVGPFLVRFAFALLYELLLHGARAMWVENGQLVFVPFAWPGSLTSYLFRTPIVAIESATIGRITSWPLGIRGIMLYRKGGGFAEAPAHFYSEPVEVVHARLCQALGIKPDATATLAEAAAVVGNLTKN